MEVELTFDVDICRNGPPCHTRVTTISASMLPPSFASTPEIATHCHLLHDHKMHLDTVGEVIATRTLSLVDVPSRELRVKIGKPQLSEHNDYYCPIQVTGIGDESVHSVVGIDSIQALELAMRFLGTTLQHLNTQHRGRIRWNDAPKGWFGLPIDTKL
jgi:hypothetical protein